MKLLLKHGANIDEKANDGETPIAASAREGHTDTVRFLLSAGADPYISGGRDIHAASVIGDIVEVERFIRAGVDVNKKDKKGQIFMRRTTEVSLQYFGHHVMVTRK